MIEMCALEGEHLTCINGETLDTSQKLYESGMSMYGCYMMLSVYREGHGITSCVFITTVT